MKIMSTEATSNAVFENTSSSEDLDFEVSDENPEGDDLGGEVETLEDAGSLAGDEGGDAKGTEPGEDTIVTEDDEEEQNPPADKAGDKDKTDQPEKHEKGGKNNLNERFKKMTARVHTAEDRAERAEAELAKLKGEAGKQDTSEPNEEDFDSYEDYLDALSEYRDKGGDEDDKQDDQSQKDSADFQADFMKAQKSVMRQIDGWEDCPEDFEQVAFDKSVEVSAAMVLAISEMENPGEALYALGKNPDKAMDIANMAPRIPDFDGLPATERTKVIRKLMNQAQAIEDLVSSKPKTEDKPAGQKQSATKQVTSAPDPITPTAGDSAKVTKDLNDMSFEEFDDQMSREDSGRFW
jgi:hypothetical protein